MAKFEEDKIITALHPEKAEVGKIYFYSDELLTLKDCIEDDKHRAKLRKINADCNEAFSMESDYAYRYLYPYEEQLEQRMTNRQFCEWYNRGNGQWKWKDSSQCHTDYSYPETNDNKEVDKDIHIRPWDSEDWVEPTVDVYERDCKGGKK